MIGMKIAAGMILVMALAAAASGATGCSPGSESLRIGSLAPDFKLNNLNGQPVSLKSFGEKLVLLNFWSSGSSSCTKDRPIFQELSENWAGRNDRVLLTISIGEEPDIVKDFMESKKYTFPVLLDTQYEVSAKYDVQYMPASILIGKDGKIKLNTIGEFKSAAAIDLQLAGFSD